MFKIVECDQRSPDWFEARKGLFTASQFDKLITKTGKPSTSVSELINRYVAEIIVGVPDDTFQSEAMLRGKELEDEALSFLEFTHSLNFKQCGFIDSQKGYGCSPDGIDLENQIGLELKCPSAHTHIEYISSGELPDRYKAQVQGSMLVTGFKRWVFMSYHPDIKPLVIIVERDEEYINALQDILNKSVLELTKKKESVINFLGDELETGTMF
jgi:putative phage-type endonuclease